MKRRIDFFDFDKLIDLGDDVATNLDGSINATIAEELKENEDFVAQYSAWNFCGYVRWNKEKQVYICEVWTFNVPREHFEAPDIRSLMKDVSDEYGYE